MTSATANLSYGFMFEEGFEFPWSDDEDCDIEEWWVDVNGYVNPVECPFDDKGEYKDGFTSADADARWRNQREWLKSNPVPVKIVEYGWAQNPCIILAVKELSSFSDCDPVSLNPNLLFLSVEDDRLRLANFVQKFGIETTGEPRWWLSACID
jgi:hypothetical protein